MQEYPECMHFSRDYGLCIIFAPPTEHIVHGHTRIKQFNNALYKYLDTKECCPESWALGNFF